MPTLADKAVTMHKTKGMVISGQSLMDTSKGSVAHAQMMKKLDTAIKSMIAKKGSK